MRYVLNSAVITGPGLYRYRIIHASKAEAWLRAQPFLSTIGYQETATALTELTGVEVEVNRRMVAMQPGDEALVFRLVFPPGTDRVASASKGSIGVEFIHEHCEIGILAREE